MFRLLSKYLLFTGRQLTPLNMTAEENKLRQLEEIEALCAIFDSLVKVVDDRKFAGRTVLRIFPFQ